jgi:hypothetical protein
MSEIPLLLTVVVLEEDTIAQYMLYQNSKWERTTATEEPPSCPPANRYQINLCADDIGSIERKLHLLTLIGGE